MQSGTYLALGLAFLGLTAAGVASPRDGVITLQPGGSVTLDTTTVVCSGDSGVKILSSYCGCTGGGTTMASLHRYLVLSNGRVEDTPLASYSTAWECQNAVSSNPLCQTTK